MSSNTTLSPQAQSALRSIHALRQLPETSGTVAAERKVLNTLNGVDTLAVAIVLYEEDLGGGQ
jgi:hypothetical protein